MSSPVNGTITQWHLTTVTSGQFALRVLRPSRLRRVRRGGQGGAERRRAPVSKRSRRTCRYQSGDLIGVDISDGGGSGRREWQTDRATSGGLRRSSTARSRPSDSDFGGAVLVSADVQYPDPASPATPAVQRRSARKREHKRSAESAKKKKCKKKKKQRG